MTAQPKTEDFSRNACCPMCQTVLRSGVAVGDGHITWPGGRVSVTQSQELLFAHLLRRRVASVDSLVFALYGHRPEGEPESASNTVAVQFTHLRKKLRAAGFPGSITAVWGRGLSLNLFPAETIEQGK